MYSKSTFQWQLRGFLFRGAGKVSTILIAYGTALYVSTILIAVPEDAPMNARKRAIATLTALLCLIGLTFTALRFTKAPALHYDNAYWPEESTQDERWIWAKTSAGITYSLYLPEHLRGDAVELEKKALVPESIPMIVCFHGSTGKHTAKTGSAGYSPPIWFKTVSVHRYRRSGTPVTGRILFRSPRVFPAHPEYLYPAPGN